jgi:serine/threonine protein kinase
VAITLDQIRAQIPPNVTIATPLGTGGQGTVYRGTFNGQPAAVKIFQPATDARRVDRECDVLASLSCPNVVRLFDHLTVTVVPEQVRVVLYEYHDGGDLMIHLQAGSPTLPEADLVAIGAQVSNGIETLWSKRIVHRDIKPANIVRASDGHHLLVDVGLARHLDLSDITAAGGAPGTLGFRSPEQARGRKSLTIHSDAFSLGVTLYCLATKQHPFGFRDLTTPARIDTRPLTNRGLSPNFARLVGQMLQFAPASRPSNLVARFAALGAP